MDLFGKYPNGFFIFALNKPDPEEETVILRQWLAWAGIDPEGLLVAKGVYHHMQERCYLLPLPIMFGGRTRHLMNWLLTVHEQESILCVSRADVRITYFDGRPADEGLVWRSCTPGEAQRKDAYTVIDNVRYYIAE